MRAPPWPLGGMRGLGIVRGDLHGLRAQPAPQLHLKFRGVRADIALAACNMNSPVNSASGPSRLRTSMNHSSISLQGELLHGRLGFGVQRRVGVEL